MKRMIIAMTLIAVALTAGAASAQVLWDQTAGYESWQQGFFNAVAGGPPFGSTNYTCNDVTVGGTGWLVDAITVYYDGFDFSWDGAIAQAVLFVEPKTGSLPTGNPATDGITVTASAGYLPNGFMAVTATGLLLELEPGEYWIGLTPIAPTPDNIHVSVPAVGDDSPTFDPNGFPMPMWTTWSPGLDGAMLIEGEIAVPNENESWGGVKSLFR